MALIGQKNNRFHLIVEFIYESKEISGLTGPLREFLQAAKAKDAKLQPGLCCISGAGPIAENRCDLTNVAWKIDGNEIKREFQIETIVINDFSAIAYGIPTLDLNNSAQVCKIPHLHKADPKPEIDAVKVVIGAGTGLGVGYLVPRGNHNYIAYPSEGGHAGFADFDPQSKAIKSHIRKAIAKNPDTEMFLSGQGINNIYQYFKAKQGFTVEGIFTAIDAADEKERPALISKNAAFNPVCKKIMQNFARIYANYASNIALTFLPLGGLFLGGGIAVKNQELFLAGNLFMKSFEENCRENIKVLLSKIPVYIIKDYSISLYGAANAAVNLLKKV